MKAIQDRTGPLPEITEVLLTLGEIVVITDAFTFQECVGNWVRDCFQSEHISNDPIERGHRLFEEATELVQTTGVTREDCHTLVDYVYDRPVGEQHQEIGGLMVCIAALCNAVKRDMNLEGRAELARCWKHIDKIRQKQKTKPLVSPLPGIAPE